MYFTFPNNSYLSDEAYTYVSDQFAFMRDQINQNNNTSTFWQLADGVLTQLKGIYDGY